MESESFSDIGVLLYAFVYRLRAGELQQRQAEDLESADVAGYPVRRMLSFVLDHAAYWLARTTITISSCFMATGLEHLLRCGI